MNRALLTLLILAGCPAPSDLDPLDDSESTYTGDEGDTGDEQTLDAPLPDDGCGVDDCAEICADVADPCERQRCEAGCRDEIVGQCECLSECAAVEVECVDVRDCGIVADCVQAAEQCRAGC